MSLEVLIPGLMVGEEDGEPRFEDTWVSASVECGPAGRVVFLLADDDHGDPLRWPLPAGKEARVRAAVGGAG